jgi:hypothetical protein
VLNEDKEATWEKQLLQPGGWGAHQITQACHCDSALKMNKVGEHRNWSFLQLRGSMARKQAWVGGGRGGGSTCSRCVSRPSQQFITKHHLLVRSLLMPMSVGGYSSTPSSIFFGKRHFHWAMPGIPLPRERVASLL